MQYSRYLIVALILSASLLIAGCTQGQKNPVPGGTPTPAVQPGIPQLLIDPSDLPPNFTLVLSFAKSPGDVGTVARDLGYEGGYIVRYIMPAADQRGPTNITQSIAFYPEKNIPSIISLSDKQDQSDPDLSYTDLPAPGLGNDSRGFFGNAKAQVIVKPTNENPLATGPGSHDVAIVFTREVAEILFAKGTTFEAIRMEGPGANATITRELAEKAYSKIP